MNQLLKVLLHDFSGTHLCGLTLNLNGKAFFSHNEHLTFPSASMGKIFILGYLSDLTHSGDINLDQIIQVENSDIVGDSGLLQYLHSRDYTYNDLATLVAAVSDNSATNTLIRVLGLQNIKEYTQSLGLKETGVLDLIRDVRNPTIHPFAPSQSNSFEYAKIIERIQRDSTLRMMFRRTGINPDEIA